MSVSKPTLVTSNIDGTLYCNLYRVNLMLDNESVSKSCRFTKATDIVITITKMGTFLEFQITINPKNTDADWTMEGSITMKAALNDQMNLDEPEQHKMF